MNLTRKHAKYITTGTAFVGALGGAAAHAQYVIDFPTGATATTPGTLYFDVDDAQTSTTDTTLEFYANTNEAPASPKVGANSLLTEGVTDQLTVGDTVDGSQTFSAGGDTTNKLSNGTNYVGYYIYEPFHLTPNYGYFVIDQTQDAPGVTPGDPGTFTDTLVETVFDPTRGEGVKITAAPEPGTASLLLAGAMGAAGLAAWRRRPVAQTLS